jgi:choline dehydrogenase
LAARVLIPYARAVTDTDQHDYIIIGAGSAGCALAHRLAQDSSKRVLLLEAGGSDRSIYIRMPAALIRAIGNPRYDWCYTAEPDASRNSRVDLWPAGRTRGGSSAINGMLYVRGAANDYDRWAAAGCEGWSAEEVLPIFRRLEGSPLGEDGLRGRDGPVKTSALRTVHPMAPVFIDAARKAGVAFNPDYNGATQEGIAYTEVSQQRGRRFSAAHAYLDPIRGQANVELRSQAQAERLTFENGRCTGVEYRWRGKRRHSTARREVILCAGAIGSPKLLMLSGIGPGQALQDLGITVQVDAPGVGANLQEHPEGMVGIDVNVRTYNVEVNSWRIVLHAANWLFRGRGPATSPYPHAVAFIRSSPEVPHPDLQVQFGPYAFSFSEEGVLPYGRPAISASVNISYPKTRGRVFLNSSAFDAPPGIEHGLLSDPDDLALLISGCKQVHRWLTGPAFDDYRVADRLPGPDVQSDDEWADYLRATAFLGYHPSGTCRMGSDAESVTTPELRVRGVDGLRVADASIIPTLISGNTNATAMMIGERAADFLGAAG